MDDLAKSPLVREQKTFEQKLAAAVFLKAREDFMLFDEATEPKSKQTRHDRKRRSEYQASAARFFDPSKKGTERGTSDLQFWKDILMMGRERFIDRDGFNFLFDARQRTYDVAKIQRLTGALPGFPPEVVAEAYRRVVEARYLVFYANHCTGFPTKSLPPSTREYWKGLYLATLKPADVQQEAEDVMFEKKNGVAA